MRVLVVTNMYPTRDEPWFGSFVRDQVDDLVAAGVDVEVTAFDGRPDARRYAWASREARARVRRDGFELVHAHYGLTGAAVALGFPRAPLVTTFHGSDFGGPAWQRVASTFAARRSTAIVVNTEGVRRLRAKRAAVIPMGVDVDLFTPLDRPAARRELGWPEEGRYALLAGSRSNPVKRADLFDAAVAHAREAAPDLQPQALEGYPRERVPLVLNAVDVTVLTSDHEGSPLTLRESLACCTPVVSVDAGDARAMLDGLPGCRLTSRDPAVIADGIVGALEAPRAPELRRRAEQWSRARVAELVAATYEQAVEAR